MANTIKIKRSVPPSTSAPTALARGELAYQENTKLLFIGSGDETSGVAANMISLADGTGTARPCNGTGTQVSTDVSLAGTPDYITLSTQTLTLGQIDLAADVTGDLPDAEIASADTWNAKHTPGGALAMGNTKVTGLATPTDDTDASTKGYVDSLAQGLDVKASVRLATTDELECVYANQPAATGIGATLTADANEVLTLDSVAVALNNRVLVKSQGGSATDAENGIYTLTTVGTAGAKWVLTRATDFDENDEITAAAFVFVEEGTTLKDTGWVAQTNDPITFSSNVFSGIGFTQFSGVGSYTAGSGLNLTGTQFGIADEGVTLARMADVTANTVIGRLTDGGVPTLLSAANVLSMISVSSGAQVNVKADWTQATSSNDAYVQNKPALGGAALLDVGTDSDEVCAGDDSRLSDSRAPTAHSHGVATGGTGATTLTKGAVLLGNTVAALQQVAKAAAGTLLTSEGNAAGDGAVWSSSLSGITIDCGTF